MLDRSPSLPFHAVIHEAALRTRVADRKVARDQLAFLLQQSERPNVTIQVVPFDADHFGGAGHSMLHAQGPVPQLDTIEAGGLPGAVWLDAEAQLAKYRALLDKAIASALPVATSRDVVQRVARDM